MLKKFSSILLLAILTFIGCNSITLNEDNNDKPQDNQLIVHFIDVGQGDSTLIECDGEFMLIDAGENDQGDVVVSYLKEIGVEKINYLIGTHPHSDHIGGLDTVINNFDIKTFIMPEIEHTTKTFEDVLDAAIKSNLSLTLPVAGQEYVLGNAEFIIIAPNDNYKNNLNNWSIGIKLTHGDNSFVFTGDAESSAERDILKNGIDIEAAVFHAGHHGSSTSNSEELLKAINPKYIVISCGKDNSYGHPHKEVMESIDKYEIICYRTDINGTIIATSDRKDIKWSFSITSTTAPDIVYVSKTSEKYHVSECSYLSKSKNEITLKEAVSSGYTPCSRCKPPQ